MTTDLVEATEPDPSIEIDAPKPKRAKKDRLRAELSSTQERVSVLLRRLRIVLAALLVTILVAALGTFFLERRVAQAQVRADRAADALTDLAAVRKTAEDYTKKALTIDFNRAADYVTSLAEGTTKSFGDTFAMNENGAGPLIVELQQQLRMVASGEVVHSQFDGDLAHPPGNGQPWDVIVIANQTSTTAQQPDKSTQVMVLRVVVVQLDGRWKVANFGPDPKSMGVASSLPGIK